MGEPIPCLRETTRTTANTEIKNEPRLDGGVFSWGVAYMNCEGYGYTPRADKGNPQSNDTSIR